MTMKPNETYRLRRWFPFESEVVAPAGRGMLTPTNRKASTMNDRGIQFLTSQLPYHGPALFVYFVAGVLSLIYMSRMTLPALLTLAGVVTMTIATFLSVGMQAFLLQTQSPAIGKTMMVVGIVGSCLRAVGLGLVVAAVFVGRDAAHRADPYLHEE